MIVIMRGKVVCKFSLIEWTKDQNRSSLGSEHTFPLGKV